MLGNGIKPHYFDGRTATVVKVNRKSASVRVHDTEGINPAYWRKDGTVPVPFCFLDRT